MADEYETFVRDTTRVLSGRDCVLTLRDLTEGRSKYRGINVRAVVSRPPRAGEPILWIRSVVGLKDPEPCSLRIVEELPETFVGAPYSDYFTALERAQR
jgi:hypothetical protein